MVFPYPSHEGDDAQEKQKKDYKHFQECSVLPIIVVTPAQRQFMDLLPYFFLILRVFIVIQTVVIYFLLGPLDNFF